MLGKSKQDEINGVPESRPIDFEAKETKTIIGENISIEGNIRGEGDLVIEGSVKGSVELEKYHLIVGSKGRVEGGIKAGDVTVSGRIVGNITALNKISLTKEANFDGEIKSKRISVEDGAYLKATIELEQEANIKALPKIKFSGENISEQPDKSVSPASEAGRGK
jgi:cytoskeletal protein CcmA (bactofilin family)